MGKCNHEWAVFNGIRCAKCNMPIITAYEQLRQQLAAEQAKSAEIWQELLELRAERESDRQECSACSSHKDKLEATIAAMRLAVGELKRQIYGTWAAVPDRFSRLFAKALSNTAGAEYAERVKKLEEAAQEICYKFNETDKNTTNYKVRTAIDNLKAVLGEGKA